MILKSRGRYLFEPSNSISVVAVNNKKASHRTSHRTTVCFCSFLSFVLYVFTFPCSGLIHCTIVYSFIHLRLSSRTTPNGKNAHFQPSERQPEPIYRNATQHAKKGIFERLTPICTAVHNRKNLSLHITMAYRQNLLHAIVFWWVLKPGTNRYNGLADGVITNTPPQRTLKTV